MVFERFEWCRLKVRNCVAAVADQGLENVRQLHFGGDLVSMWLVFWGFRRDVRHRVSLYLGASLAGNQVVFERFECTV